MKRLVLMLIAVGLIVALAAPVMADGKERKRKRIRDCSAAGSVVTDVFGQARKGDCNCPDCDGPMGPMGPNEDADPQGPNEDAEPKGPGGGYGPGDGEGNEEPPEDGSGYGPGECAG